MKVRTEERCRRGTPFSTVWPLLMLLIMLSGVALARVADSECGECHDDVVASYKQTDHFVYLGAGADELFSCESCHGSGDAHIEDGDPLLIINPRNRDADSEADVCLDCHNNHQFDDWDFSAHNNADVGCADCHSIHTPQATVDEQLCYDCHSRVRAEFSMPSHHPIIEGKVGCNDCHNVHGGSTMFEMGLDDRELCISCHAEKEGPHFYEHEPVNEDCMICHSPHGTVADNLLKLNEPALCLNCHAMHFHVTVESVDGDFDVPMAPERASSSTPDGWKSGMLTKCTQCHTMIHGTDNPSQTITTGGNALTR